MKIACGMAFTEGSLGKQALILVGGSGRVLELLDELFVLDGFFVGFGLEGLGFHFKLLLCLGFIKLNQGNVNYKFV